MFKKYFLPLIVIFGIGLTGTLITLYKITPCIQHDPRTYCGDYSSLGLILMSLSLLLALTGLLSLINLLIRWQLYHHEVFANHFNISLRQGFLLGLTVLLALIMLIAGIFKWWSILILFGIIIGIEYYFSGRDGR